MSLRERLGAYQIPSPEKIEADYQAWRKKLRRQEIIFFSIIAASLVVEYTLLFLLVFRR